MDIQAYIQSGIIESYVLGLATNEEVAELEILRVQHPEVEDAIEAFSVSLEAQALANAIPPPAGVKESIMKEIRSGDKKQTNLSQLIPHVDSDENLAPVVRLHNTWKSLAVASVILFIVSTALNFYFYNKYDEKQKAYQSLLTERDAMANNTQVIEARLKELETAKEMMADPSMLMVRLNAVPGKDQNAATVLWNSNNKDVYVIPNKLALPAKGMQYQLWALVDGKPVDAGMIDMNCSSACRMKNIPKAQAFAITLEKAGGSPTPTMEAMYVFGKV